MTVGELIDKLMWFDPEMQVGLIDYQEGWRTLNSVRQETNLTDRSRVRQTVELN